MMEWITGKSDFVGREAVIDGWTLGIQKLDQVPQILVQTAIGPKLLRDHFRQEWGNNFETYIIMPGKGQVKGILWEINKEERELVKNWERVDYWYKEVQVKVKIDKGEEIVATSECLGDNQSFDRKVDGLNYDSFLLPKKSFKIRAEKAREMFYKRIGL